MYYREQLESIRSALADLHEDLLKEASGLPEGSLYVYNKKGNFYYCQRLPKEGNRKKERRVTITMDSDIVLALVRKKYVESALENVKRDIKAIDDMLAGYKPVSEEMVMEKFCSKYPELSGGIHYGKRDPEKWAEGYKPKEKFFVEDLKSVSSKGEDMRSGGEMYISSRLEHFGIPYRYEAPLNIPDLNYAPDFSILRPRDRKIIYWEHFGKVTDYDYVYRNIGKVKDYIDYGIKPWDNFIMTFNNEKGGYNGKLIDAMIECWLL